MRSLVRRLGATAAAASLTVLAAAPVSAQKTYTSLTMFGDSFSDIGNAAALTGGAVPARFSNGPIWSDMLATSLGRAGDARAAFVPQFSTGVYAIAGATTASTSPSSTFAQIGRWCLATSGGVCTRGADPTGLYTMFAGANDVRGAASLGTDAARKAAVVAAANNVLTQGGGLLTLGARNILFSYLPDLGLTPQGLGGGQSAVLSDLTRLFNSTLEAGIAGLRLSAPTGTSIFDLRLDNLFSNIARSPATYGFTNLNTPCVVAAALPSCAGFVFWDDLHPTSFAHAYVGAAAYNLVANGVNVSPIPEPATIVLTGTGLLALGAIARRRRAA